MAFCQNGCKDTVNHMYGKISKRNLIFFMLEIMLFVS